MDTSDPIKVKAYYKVWRAKNKAKIAAYNKARREKDLIGSRLMERGYRSRNKERVNAYFRSRYSKHMGEEALRKKLFKMAHPEVVAARNKKYSQQNRDKINLRERGRKRDRKAYQKAAYHANPERARSRRMKWAAANQEKLKAGKRADYVKRREYCIAKQKRYYSENKEKYFAATARRRALKQSAFSDGSAKAFYDFVRSKKSIPCYYCGKRVSGKKAHIDHVIALSKSGNHASGNLCASCPTCNLRKNVKLPSEIPFVNQTLLNL